MTALARYRLAARVVGVALVLLVLVAMPLQFVGHDARWVHVIGPIHGLLYLLYLASVIDLRRVVRLSGWDVATMVFAGLIPFLTFVIERRIVASLGHSEKSQVHRPH